MNVKNLKKLANYIKNHVSDEQFNMKYFRSNMIGHEVPFRKLSDCGTVGCALGHAPFVISPKASDYELESLNFFRYGYRVFGLRINDDRWDYLFDFEYSYHDNTREGFVGRVETLIKYPDMFKGGDCCGGHCEV